MQDNEGRADVAAFAPLMGHGPALHKRLFDKCLLNGHLGP